MSVRYFYTTIKAMDGDRVFWCEVPQLRRSIEAIAGKVANDEAVYLDLWQWLQNDPNNQLVKSHWMVFLQYRSCMVTQRVYQNIGDRIDADYETLFYYLLNLLVTAITNNPSNFYGNFQDKKTKTGFFRLILEKWTDKKLRNTLYNFLRGEYKTIGRTNLGIVSLFSANKIQKVLRTSGIFSENHLLIFNCFREVKKASLRSLDKWQEEDWQQVIDRLQQLQPQVILTVEEVQAKLNQIGEIMRNHIDPPYSKFVPTNYDNDSNYFWENLSSKRTNQDLLQQQEIQEDINKLLITQEEEVKQIVYFYYHEKMTQVQIANRLGVHPSTISREITQLCKKIYQLLSAREGKDCPILLNEIKLESRQKQEIDAYLEYFCQSYLT
ncbi:helix-turn-helix domain containing protein [Microcystis aeruginosa EAWAG127a]|uniref:Helix-turn-helix domain containing protein n=1 Tax=Microcystis aeruginosa EAWAG127a TaxID=2529855 RepID=A0A5J5LSC6_MICAE|nr:helix-turn-helix domain-containing protein [Microcystis aeruginosa]KAB0240370.1 helix-turn-helix domain containing protein [Microcystis aeruginosa EAWAG127a]MDB9415230.1 helix-turn-helix domain-containing protein [Microcystis aeruginosa CS-556/03]